MSTLEKLATALGAWAFILVLTNPFFESERRARLAAACAVAATICWVLA